MTENAAQTFSEWGIVELMGHQRTAGRLSEMNLAGASFLRVDIPDDDSKAGFVTKFYGASAIYCIHVTDEAAARLAATACDRQAISSWSMDEYMERRRLKEGQPVDDVDERETFEVDDEEPS